MLGAVSSDERDAELALHRRSASACAAAGDAGVPGRFRTWEHAGLLAVLATDPALGFLSTVGGVTRETVPEAIELVHAHVWHGVRPTIVVPAGRADAVLSAAGLVRAEDRILAVRRLVGLPDVAPHLDVVEARSADTFLDVLLSGYEVDGVLAAFIGAEHRLPAMRRFLVLEQHKPIAAAAMTVHGDIGVLGGASTLPAHRGRGAQSLSLRHRLRVAADAGCVLAVATARPDSVSAANLRRAGFRLTQWAKWRVPVR